MRRHGTAEGLMRRAVRGGGGAEVSFIYKLVLLHKTVIFLSQSSVYSRLKPF